MTEVELKGWGNSIGVILPAEKLKELGLKKGDKVEIDVIPKKRLNGFGMFKGIGSYDEKEESHEEFW